MLWSILISTEGSVILLVRRPLFALTLIYSLICLGLLCPRTHGQNKSIEEVNMAKCWSFPLAETTGVQLTSDHSRVFIGTGNGKIDALSVAGEKTWSSEFGGEISSNFVVAAGSFFFVTSAPSSGTANTAESKLRSVSKETGITNWTVKISDADQHFLHNFNGSIITVSTDGELISIDARQGKVKWKRVIANGFAAEPKFTANEVIVATVANQIFSLSMATGQIGSLRKTAYGVTALTALRNLVLIAGDERGNIFSLNGADKPLWLFKTGGKISSVLPLGDDILAASHDNFVYFLDGNNGGRTWKKRLSGRVGRAVSIGDQYALLSVLEEQGAILVDISNGRTIGRILLDEGEVIVSASVVFSMREPVLHILTNRSVHSYSLKGRPGCID